MSDVNEAANVHKFLASDATRPLIDGWIRHFWSADRELEWVAAETEHQVWLAPDVVLMGRIDAIGRDTLGKFFFGEWKSSNGRDRLTWKQTWRLNPQSLTYGVLAGSAYPDCSRFTVRKAFKPSAAKGINSMPTYDHAWYSYSEAELNHWRQEVVGIASEIRAYLADGSQPWPTNFSHCFQYGVNYACPFFENGCSKMDWNRSPEGSIKRISHLDAERGLNRPNAIVLDATRIKTWLECRERFRREYMDNVTMPPGEALQTGIELHDGLGQYYQGLIKQKGEVI